MSFSYVDFIIILFKMCGPIAQFHLFLQYFDKMVSVGISAFPRR